MTRNRTLEGSTVRIGRTGPIMLTVVVNSNREQDAQRAYVLRRRPAAHTEFHEDDEARAEDFAGEAKYTEVEIPVPHREPHRVAAVLKVASVDAIDALRVLLDEAEHALGERYPEEPTAPKPPVTEAPKPEPLPVMDARELSCQALDQLDPDTLVWHGRHVEGYAAEMTRRGEDHVRACEDVGHTADWPEPTPEQLAKARATAAAIGLPSANRTSQALYMVGFLASTVRSLADKHHTGGPCGVDRCQVCELLGNALAMLAVDDEHRAAMPTDGAEGGGSR